MVLNGGRLLLLLASRDVQCATQLAMDGNLDLAETLRRLQSLVDEGFVVAFDDAHGMTVYRLSPRDACPETTAPHRRLLVVENDAMLRDVVVKVLEHEGYAIIAVSRPADAVTLLGQVAFDLVITDGFSSTPESATFSSIDVLESAGTTPVALFTAHRVELDAAQAAGFRDVIAKPFGIELLWRQVGALLRS